MHGLKGNPALCDPPNRFIFYMHGLKLKSVIVRPSKPFHILYAWSEVYEAEIMSGEIQ
jgi:hypothetical protein